MLFLFLFDALPDTSADCCLIHSCYCCTSCVVGSGHIVSSRLVIFNTLLERLSNRITEGVNVMSAKDDSLEETEEVTLEGFGKEICEHLRRGAMADVDVMGLNAIFQPKITHVNVTGFGTGGSTTIGGKADSTFIILFEDITGDRVILSIIIVVAAAALEIMILLAGHLQALLQLALYDRFQPPEHNRW